MTNIYARLSHRAATMRASLAFEAALTVTASRAGLEPHRGRLDPNAVRHGPAAPVARVRDEAIYLACTSCEVSQRALARALGLSQQALSKRVIAVADRREDHAYDRALDEIEIELMELALC